MGETFDTDTLDRLWKQQKCYIIYNILMWFIIGGVIFYVNFYHEMKQRKDSDLFSDCCKCASLNVRNNDKYDWGYCLYYFNKDYTCDNYNWKNLTEMTKPFFIYPTDMMDRIVGSNGNVDHLSVTAFNILTKNYIVYGTLAIICVTLYGLLVFCTYSLGAKTVDTIKSNAMKWFYYNVFMSALCYFAFLKRYQYYTVNDSDNDILCEKNSVDTIIESILESVFISELAVYILPWFLACCKICCSRRPYGYKRCISKIDICLFIISILLLILFLIMLWVFCGYIIASRIPNKKDTMTHKKDTIIIFIMGFVIFIKIFDSFMIRFFRIECYQKCKYIMNSKDYKFADDSLTINYDDDTLELSLLANSKDPLK